MPGQAVRTALPSFHLSTYHASHAPTPFFPSYAWHNALYILHILARPCNENPIYVFLFWELRSLRSSFHIHVSVSDSYIPRIGPHIFFCKKGKSIVGLYKSLTEKCVEIGTEAAQFLFWEYLLRIFGSVSLQWAVLYINCSLTYKIASVYKAQFCHVGQPLNTVRKVYSEKCNFF
jgi:hypothetical protein